MIEIGNAVTFVDSVGGEHPAIVTNRFGGYGAENQPSINLVYVSDDEKQNDQYGRQIIRQTSVVHQSNQYAHGMFWK